MFRAPSDEQNPQQVLQQQVNPEFFYRGNDIVKLWEKYLKTQNPDIRFYSSSDESALESLFDPAQPLNQQKESVIVLNSDGTPYTNKDSHTISLGGEVGYRGEAELRHNGIGERVSQILKQVRSYNSEDARQIKITNHIIIFPYHALPGHWNLGQIYLRFNIDGTKLEAATITVYEPYGTRVTSGHDELIEDINAALEGVRIQAQDAVLVNQQHDGSSCGGISAENGKEFLKRTTETASENLLLRTYEFGAIKLRIQHIEEIKDSADDNTFFEAQCDNRVYEAQGDQKIANKDRIIQFLKEAMDILEEKDDWVKDALNSIKSLNSLPVEQQDEVNKISLDLVRQFLLRQAVANNIKAKEIVSLLLKANGDWHCGAIDLINELAAEVYHSVQTGANVKEGSDDERESYEERATNLINEPAPEPQPARGSALHLHSISTLISDKVKSAHELDSDIKELLKPNKIPPKTYFKTLKQLAVSLPNSSYILKLCDKVSLFPSLSVTDKAELTYYKANYYFQIEEHTNAISYYRKATEYYKQAKKYARADEMITFELRSLIVMRSMETHKCAKKLIEKEAILTKDNLQYTNICYSLGEYYMVTLGEWRQGIKYFQKVVESASQPEIVSFAYLRIGQAWIRLDDLEKAKDYLNKSKSYPNAPISYKVDAFYELAELYKKEGNITKSNVAINCALQFANENSSIDTKNLLLLKKANLEESKQFTEIATLSVNTEKPQSFSDNKFVRITKNDLNHLKHITSMLEKLIDTINIQDQNTHIEELVQDLDDISNRFCQISRITKANYKMDNTATLEGNEAPDGIRVTLSRETIFKDIFVNFGRLKDILSSDYKNKFVKHCIGKDIMDESLKTFKIIVDLMLKTLSSHQNYKSFFSAEEVSVFASSTETVDNLKTTQFKELFTLINVHNDLIHLQNILNIFENESFKYCEKTDFSVKEDRYIFSHLITLIGEHAKNIVSLTEFDPLKKLFKSLETCRDVFTKNSSLILETHPQRIIFFKDLFFSQQKQLQGIVKEVIDKLEKSLLGETLTLLSTEKKFIEKIAIDLTKIKKAIDNAGDLKKTNVRIVELLEEQKKTVTDLKDIKRVESDLKDQRTKETRLQKELKDVGYDIDDPSLNKADENLHWSISWINEYNFLRDLLFNREDFVGKIEAVRGIINYLHVSVSEAKNPQLFSSQNDSYAEAYSSSMRSHLTSFRNKQISHDLFKLLKDYGLNQDIYELIQSNAEMVFIIMSTELCEKRMLLDYYQRQSTPVEHLNLTEDDTYLVYASYISLIKFKLNNDYSNILQEYNNISEICSRTNVKLKIDRRDVLSDIEQIVFDAYLVCTDKEELDDEQRKLADIVYERIYQRTIEAQEEAISANIIEVIKHSIYRLSSSTNVEESEKETRATKLYKLLELDSVTSTTVERDKKYFFMLKVILSDLYIWSNQFDEAQKEIESLTKGIEHCNNPNLRDEYTIKKSILVAKKNIHEDPTKECLQYYRTELENISQDIKKQQFKFISKERSELLMQQVRKLIDETQEGLAKHLNIDLRKAAQDGDLEAVKLLLEEKNADPNDQAKNGRTALHFAVSNNHVDVVKYLALKTELTIKDSEGNTPFDIASSKKYTSLLSLLEYETEPLNLHVLSAPAALPPAPEPEVPDPAGADDAEDAVPASSHASVYNTSTSSSGAGASAASPQQLSKPVTPSVREFNIKKVEKILETDNVEEFQKFLDAQMFNINSQDNSGYTVMHYAMWYHSNKILELLTKKNGDPFFASKLGDSTFSIAVSEQEIGWAKSFLSTKKDEILGAGLSENLCDEDEEDEKFYHDLATCLGTNDLRLANILGLDVEAKKTCFLEAIRVCKVLAIDYTDLLGSCDFFEGGSYA